MVNSSTVISLLIGLLLVFAFLKLSIVLLTVSELMFILFDIEFILSIFPTIGASFSLFGIVLSENKQVC